VKKKNWMNDYNNENTHKSPWYQRLKEGNTGPPLIPKLLQILLKLTSYLELEWQIQK